MKLRPYPRYKPSGIDWLGDVPAHWTPMALRYLCRLAYGDALAAEDRDDGAIEVFGSNGPVGTHSSANTSSPAVIVGRKGSFGKVNYTSRPVFSIDTTYFIDKNCTKNHIRWIFYLLSISGLDAITKNSAVPGLSRKDAYNHRIAVPLASEQAEIAKYLDEKTVKLDYLIVSNQKLLDYLQEKRYALISRTVTRGLPPDAALAAGLDPHPKLKPSGAGWISDIPEHWSSVPLGYLARFKGGATPDKENLELWDGIIPWVSPKDMKRAHIFNSEDHISEDALLRSPLSMLPIGGVLVVVRGMILVHSFPVAIADVPLTINQDMKAILCGPRVSSDFMFWCLSGFEKAFVSRAEESAHGTRRLETPVLAKFPVPLPPAAEQVAIVRFLANETGKADRMIAKIGDAITRLEEYRAALITAAVTGKIDLRNAVPASEPVELAAAG